MVVADAVIGLPDDGTALEHDLTAYVSYFRSRRLFDGRCPDIGKSVDPSVALPAQNRVARGWVLCDAFVCLSFLDGVLHACINIDDVV